jgi:hypothetical protein
MKQIESNKSGVLPALLHRATFLPEKNAGTKPATKQDFDLTINGARYRPVGPFVAVGFGSTAENSLDHVVVSGGPTLSLMARKFARQSHAASSTSR